jgi:Zinc carboxypeptidase
VSSPAVRDPHFQNLLSRKLPELLNLERILKGFRGNARIQVETTVNHNGMEFPIYSIVIGPEDKTLPTLGVFAGVHGLERIGSHVTIAWLQTLQEIMSWDDNFLKRLESSRLVFMPIVNPVGMFLTRRSNGSGVDLMRNSPVIAEEEPKFLIGGHTYSNLLPFYRGNVRDAETMEAEAKALCAVVEREIFPAKVSLSVDVHSGFGSVDRLWFPYAKSTKPPPNLVEIVALKRVFDRSYPNHFYRIEPQAAQYTTHGDLWDWLMDRHLAQKTGQSPNGLYIPWTLELGSWIWLKKNPQQIFSSLGAFNPLKPHRMQRILRRHITLFDFLHRALLSPQPWTQLAENDRTQLYRRAKDQWYEDE